MSERSKNIDLAGSLAIDAAKDWVMGEAIDKLTKKVGIPLEKLTGIAKGPASRLASIGASAAIEGAKGTYKIMVPETREDDAEKGEQLLREPAWYQAGNFILNSSDALSEYGAAAEKQDREYFDAELKKNKIDPKIQEAYARSSLAQMEDDISNKMIQDIEYDRNLRERNERTRAASESSGKPMGPLYGVEKEEEYNQKQMAGREKIEDEKITMNMIRAYFDNRA